MAEYFEMGGWVMYPLVLLGLMGLLGAAVVLGAVALAKVRVRVRVALGASTMLVGAALLCVGLGLLGYASSMQACLEAVAHVNPIDKQVILHAGESEAMVGVYGGLIGAAIPALVGLGLFGFGLAGRQRLTPPAKA